MSLVHAHGGKWRSPHQREVDRSLLPRAARRSEGDLMAIEETKQVLGEYVDALLGGGDFGVHFADDVRWTTMETGEVISGRDAVRDFIIAFHTQLFDASPELGGLVCGDGSAALEAVFAGKHIGEFAGVEATGAEVRVPY